MLKEAQAVILGDKKPDAINPQDYKLLLVQLLSLPNEAFVKEPAQKANPIKQYAVIAFILALNPVLEFAESELNCYSDDKNAPAIFNEFYKLISIQDVANILAAIKQAVASIEKSKVSPFIASRQLLFSTASLSAPAVKKPLPASLQYPDTFIAINKIKAKIDYFLAHDGVYLSGYLLDIINQNSPLFLVLLLQSYLKDNRCALPVNELDTLNPALLKQLNEQNLNRGSLYDILIPELDKIIAEFDQQVANKIELKPAENLPMQVAKPNAIAPLSAVHQQTAQRLNMLLSAEPKLSQQQPKEPAAPHNQSVSIIHKGGTQKGDISTVAELSKQINNREQLLQVIKGLSHQLLYVQSTYKPTYDTQAVLKLIYNLFDNASDALLNQEAKALLKTELNSLICRLCVWHIASLAYKLFGVDKQILSTIQQQLEILLAFYQEVYGNVEVPLSHLNTQIMLIQNSEETLKANKEASKLSNPFFIENAEQIMVQLPQLSKPALTPDKNVVVPRKHSVSTNPAFIKRLNDIMSQQSHGKADAEQDEPNVQNNTSCKIHS